MTGEPFSACTVLARRRKLYVAVSLLLFAPLLISIYRPVSLSLDVFGYPIGRDFINVWAGPRLAFSGQLATLFDFPRYETAIGELFGQPIPFHSWVYPLYALPAFWPLSQLPYFVALAVWTFGSFALFAAVVLRQIAPGERAAALVVLACAPACLINVVGGQNGFLTAALLVGGVLALDRRPVMAGVLFGLLTFKPHLGVVLPFALIALGAWRAFASAAVTFAALVGLSVALFGVDPWLDYLKATSALETVVIERFQGLLRFMMTSVLAGGRTLGLSYPAAAAVQLAVTVPVIAAACWAVRRTTDPCRRAFVLASAAPLATPYAFNYDLPMLVPILVWALFGRLPWRPERSAVYLLAWIVPVGLMYANMLGLGVCSLVLILFFVASLQEAVADPAPAGSGVPQRPAAAWPRPLEA